LDDNEAASRELIMLPNSFPQLIEALLRQPNIDAAQLRELIHHLPDPQTAAQEMVRRGWITQRQFSSVFRDAQQRPTPQETMLVGCGDDPADADSEDWSLPLSDDEDNLDVPPDAEWVRPHGAADEMLPGRAPSRRGMSWARQGLLMGTLILGSFFAGLQLFGANSTAPPVAHKESRDVDAGDPVRAVELPPVVVPVSNAKQRDDLLNGKGKNAPPAAPAAVAKPKAKASLYDRVRQAVLENKTEETERLGMGDFAYQSVPNDGSIMVGMAVTYTPLFTHNVIKSVRPIYQRPDGTRYDGPVCGKPTGVGDRVVAKEGYAIGAATIKAGMGIDGMQLTFMEIGPDGLNPDKTYLSKWLGSYGGASARTFVNDGRPIVGIAGMVSKLNFGPAFCMCLVTTKPEALADDDGPALRQTQPQNMQKRQQQILRPQR
jgi:hypothetical protein